MKFTYIYVPWNIILFNRDLRKTKYYPIIMSEAWEWHKGLTLPSQS